ETKLVWIYKYMQEVYDKDVRIYSQSLFGHEHASRINGKSELEIRLLFSLCISFSMHQYTWRSFGNDSLVLFLG
ncbi:hypothetical protein, partial [Salmonella sp. gx-f5]|uniref:hypothetical protein n=1 Tax=Salmonella sp. gx-f5 TaxID=2582605 RepID=UPI001F3E3876